MNCYHCATPIPQDIPNPQGGDWYIMIHGFAAYSGVSLTATY